MMLLCQVRMHVHWFKERRLPLKIVEVKIMKALSKKLSNYFQKPATKTETTPKHFTGGECVTIKWVIFKEHSTTSRSL